MPPWGRPSGGRSGKRSQKEWARPRSWEERRFEEIEDTDEDEAAGVELYLGASQKRYVSDELGPAGTGINSLKARRRKGNVYDEDSDFLEHDDEDEDEASGDDQNMQLVLREKEDFLVERALERIRRARMLGKTNVKLSQAEVDALERAEQAQKKPNAQKLLQGKKPTAPRSKKDERRKSKSDQAVTSSVPSPKAIEPRRKAKSSPKNEHLASYPASPNLDYGRQVPSAMQYGLPNHYPVPAQRPARPRSKSGSRPSSSQTLRHGQQQQQPQHRLSSPPLGPSAHPAPQQYQYPYHAGRYFSSPDPGFAGRAPSNTSLRSDPSDPNWEPRARSTSNLVPYSIDPSMYTMYHPSAHPPLPPAPPQHQSSPPPFQYNPRGARVAMPTVPRVSPEPPNMYTASQLPPYRSPENEFYLPAPPASVGGAAASKESIDDGDDDDEQDVEVDVIEQPGANYGIQTRSSKRTAGEVTALPSGSSNRGKSAAGIAKGARRGK